jgi:hypothetical protein
MLGRPWRWLPPLAQRYVEAFAGRTRPRRREVVQFLLEDAGFVRARSKYFHALSVEQWLGEPQQMRQVAAAETWAVPAIESAGALADWLALNPDELDWFADLKGLGYKNDRSRLMHYHYRVLAKRYGNIRLIEAPKPRLKAMQRQILGRILDQIPPAPGGTWVPKGTVHQDVHRPSRGPARGLAYGLAGFFPLHWRREDSDFLSHGGLSRIGRRSARRHLHERRAT